MNTPSHNTFLEAIKTLSRMDDGHGSSPIPLEGVGIFRTLVEAIREMAVAEPGQMLMVVTDADTAVFLEPVAALLAKAASVYCIGAPPRSWPDSKKIHACPYGEAIQPGDRVFAILSSHLSFVAFGASEAGEEPVQSAWTGERRHVLRIAQAALADFKGSAPEWPQPEHESPEQDLSHATALMALLTRHLGLLQRDAAMDRHDLFSVLEILKAISSKRNCHDVLYVFVEQIARVVKVHRCSVVRVWGGSSSGHVLASHDDERVSSLDISLVKYPEILRAIQTGERVIINQVAHDPLTREFAADLAKADVRSLMVIPIVLYDPNIGSLLLRAASSNQPFTAREVGFCEIVAEAASNALERAYLFESIQKANERLEHLAITDGLTGLKNHRFFRERLEDEFERARRYVLPLSVIIFDVDNFKKINDTYGHLQGDAILREMAQRTLRIVRKSDIVARYGGEEFTVIMPQTDESGAMTEAQRLLVALREPAYRGMPPGVPVTVSVGVSVLEHQRVLDCESLIRIADTALYEAKHNGKNRVTLGTVDMGEQST